ncbi:MAG: NTP transferase domain-containing protein [Methanothrix sp.]|uniref:NTP transferase domain-containing protein n=1 Tax=Methanothrix sp. TaxID=90426 RepID=UPI0019C0CB67|nr:NTP transferase domain-containing protein [Methanothrix sp.]MBC7080365.1 NTP transferase domain-containing protein [Methanothrix sp.]NPU86968.1 NTP transferase domain-containing protein [Methanothrix sp.]
MAGGKGSRLGMGEKPMVRLYGKTLIDYVVSAVRPSVERIIVATTRVTPETRRWSLEMGLEVVDTSGSGYIPDMVEAVERVGISGPVMVIMADLPLITEEIVREVIDAYKSRPEPALSVHTLLSLHRSLGRRPDVIFNYMGELIVPAGVNILTGSRISDEQEDFHLIMNRIELAININTPDDLRICERIIKRRMESQGDMD